MKKTYFTFGQAHIHSCNGITLDKDCIVEITGENPRVRMFDLFGHKWAMEYNSPPNLELYPRGIIKIQ